MTYLTMTISFIINHSHPYIWYSNTSQQTYKTTFPKLKHKNEKYGNIANINNLRKSGLTCKNMPG